MSKIMYTTLFEWTVPIYIEPAVSSSWRFLCLLLVDLRLSLQSMRKVLAPDLPQQGENRNLYVNWAEKQCLRVTLSLLLVPNIDTPNREIQHCRPWSGPAHHAPAPPALHLSSQVHVSSLALQMAPWKLTDEFLPWFSPCGWVLLPCFIYSEKWGFLPPQLFLFS